jgi:hypothetical protein
MADNKDKAEQGREGGFIHSPPEANVFPAGAAQTTHGIAGGRPMPGGTQDDSGGNEGGGGAPSAAGTPDEGRLGGSNGTSASGTTGNDPDR